MTLAHDFADKDLPHASVHAAVWKLCDVAEWLLQEGYTTKYTIDTIRYWSENTATGFFMLTVREDDLEFDIPYFEDAGDLGAWIGVIFCGGTMSVVSMFDNQGNNISHRWLTYGDDYGRPIPCRKTREAESLREWRVNTKEAADMEDIVMKELEEYARTMIPV